jgi:hypothetical protein
MQIAPSDLRRYVKLVLELPEDETTYSGRARNTLNEVVDLRQRGVGNDGAPLGALTTA